MNKRLLKDLRKEQKISEYFTYWENREFESYEGEKELIADLKRISQNMAMKEGIVLGCFDYRDLSLAFFTENIEDITGHSADFLKKNGMAGVISALHPADAQEHVIFNNLVLEAFNNASLTEKNTFELSYTLRWLHKDTGEEIWFFTKAKPYLIDPKGNFVLDLHIAFQITNSEPLRNYDWNFSYIKDDGTKVHFKKDGAKNHDIGLTKKELEIAKLIKQGYKSKEIAEHLHIALNTVFTHRKKMLKKLNAKNTAEMLKILNSHKVE